MQYRRTLELIPAVKGGYVVVQPQGPHQGPGRDVLYAGELPMCLEFVRKEFAADEALMNEIEPAHAR